MRACSCLLLLLLMTIHAPVRAETDPVAAAQAYGRARPAVTAQPDGLIVCEAEEFQVASPGWRAKPWGENYYAATFANSFLSRKAFLAAPEQCKRTETSIRVRVPAAGRYLALVRYEAAYRFETQFRLRIEQNGRRVLDRLYGARNNVKIWAFSEKLKKEVAWSWGAVENVVWEGHNASVDLKPGLATITLVADKQPEPAAKRNVDLVMLTTDVEQVRMRIDKEKYLPLDGMLTQAGDVFMKAHNQGGDPIHVTAKPCRQHSPYWVHLRNWKPLGPIDVEPGRSTDWIDVGGLLDTLNDGQWSVTISPESKSCFEFGVKAANGRIERINELSGHWGELPLAFHADTRYCRLLRHQEEVLYDLLDWLKRQPVCGKSPTRTLIYGYTFAPGLSPKYDAAIEEFKAMFGLTDTTQAAPRAGMPRDYIDVRSVRTEKLAEYCRDLDDRAKRIAVVSLGDEIGLPQPQGETAHEAFRAWLCSQGVRPQEVDSAAGGDWKRIVYDPDPSLKDEKTGLYYWSKRYLYHFGIQAIKQRTDLLRRHLPNAGIGANFSPHLPTEHVYLGETFKWVTCFRDGGMTLPWSEDYIWPTEATFADGSPGITSRTVGKGRVLYCGFLPGLSYYKPAIPMRPVDRGASDDAMSHFLPTDFDPVAAAVIGLPGADLKRPIECSQPLVETTVIQSNNGVLVPLVNWTPSPIKDLQVRLAIPLPTKHIALASGQPVQQSNDGDDLVLTLDLDVADALILR